MDGEELGQVLGVGEHCSVEHCQQIDFLPFKCDCCGHTFCLEHRSYAAHACPKAGAKETTVIVCPICAKSVRLRPGQEPNEAFDVHQRTDCDPANYAKVHKKPRCPVGGCKEKLTTINAYRCKHCSQRVCLRHRDPGDHGCTEAQAALRQQRGSTCASSRPPGALRAPTTGSAAGWASAAVTASAPPARRVDPQQLHAAALRQYDDPANSVRGTAARRQQLAAQAQQQQQTSSFQWPWQRQQQQQQQQPPSPQPAAAPAQAPTTTTTIPAHHGRSARNTSNTSNANPLVPPHLPERCPQCGTSFVTVERLIQHVEDFHPSPTAATIGTSAPAPLSSAAAEVITNPLRSLFGSTTIAGGLAPSAVPSAAPSAGGQLHAASGGGGGEGGAGEVYRCYHCSQTFRDPVHLVHHSERCARAPSSAGSRSKDVQR